MVVTVPPPVGRDVVPERIPLQVVYEDEHLLVVDKQAGMVVHPAPGHWTGTLANALMGRAAGSHVPPSGAVELPGTAPDAAGPGGPADRAGIVHRLDKDTSGLLLVAKTDDVHRALATALAQRRVRRLYATLAWGHLAGGRATVDRPIGRDTRDRKRMAIVSTGRSARTEFVRLARFDAADLLRARLYTGRTHQIRVHLASLGHPVVGDDTYGGGGQRRAMALPPRRHFLHAAWLTLQHPVTGQVLDLRSPLPPDLCVALRSAAGGAGDEGGDAYAGLDLKAGEDVLDHVGFYQLDD